MSTFDKITVERISTLHPTIRQKVLDAYMHINNKLLGKGVRLRFSHTTRTAKEQDDLYALGRTKKGSIVTNAKAWFSIHNYGLAFDIVLLLDKDGDGNFETASWDTKADFDGDKVADWMEVTQALKAIGAEWGGDWKSFKDYPHFEFNFGLKASHMKAKLDKGEYTVEKIRGVEYKYIKL